MVHVDTVSVRAISGMRTTDLVAIDHPDYDAVSGGTNGIPYV